MHRQAKEVHNSFNGPEGGERSSSPEDFRDLEKRRVPGRRCLYECGVWGVGDAVWSQWCVDRDRMGCRFDIVRLQGIELLNIGQHSRKVLGHGVCLLLSQGEASEVSDAPHVCLSDLNHMNENSKDYECGTGCTIEEVAGQRK